MKTRIQTLLEQVRSTKSENELLMLARSPEPAIALEIARSSHATARILEILARHTSIVVRHSVMLNPNVAESTLERYVDDKDQLVRDYARLNLEKKRSH